MSLGAMTEVRYLFDAITVGRQGAGTWTCRALPDYGHPLRALHRLVDLRFGIQSTNQHVHGHRGKPGNEIVDQLAKLATRGTALDDAATFFTDILSHSMRTALEWIWILFHPDYVPCIKENKLTLPRRPGLPAAEDVQRLPPFDALDPDTSPEEKIQIALTLCACNVLTLKSSARAAQEDTGIHGPSRQEMLLSQIFEEKIHIFALQETRLRKLHTADDPRYFLFRSTGTSGGHFGIMMGFSKTLRIGTRTHQGRDQSIYFAEKDFSIIAAQPRHLTIRVRHGGLRFLAIGGHAPHNGQPIEVIESWWQDLAQAIPPLYGDWPIILLADTNTRVGGEPCSQIGPFGAEEADNKNDGFTNFVRAHQIFLPATFEDFHEGEHFTWSHTSGKQSRIDFIGLPTTWAFSQCRSWISEVVDPSLERDDHRAPCASIRFEADAAPPSYRKHKRWTMDAAPSKLAFSSTPAWDLDVHCHAHHLQQDIEWNFRQVQETAPLPRHRPCMSHDAWQLVLKKRATRKALFEASQLQHTTYLQTIFTAWTLLKECNDHDDTEEVSFPLHPELFPWEILDYDLLMREQDRMIAHHLAEFRSLGRQVVKLLRRDDITFFQNLLKEGADFLHPNQTKRLWQILRRSFLKMKLHKQTYNPLLIESLEKEWTPHFQQLELGRVTTPEELAQRCLQEQHQLPGVASIDVQELPSLTTFEDALRAITPDRSTGLDPIPSGLFRPHAAQIAQHAFGLLLKTYAWQTEPLSFKGGKMALIPKHLQPVAASQYRGVMLLNTMAKAFHSLLRRQTLQVLLPHRPCGQLGGFPQQSVLFGSHALRCYAAIADTAKYSSFALFVDVSTAFHHLIREQVVGFEHEGHFEQLCARLEEAGYQVGDQFAEHFTGLLHDLGAPHLLIQILRDVHRSTWCTIDGRTILETLRGTRPGSPIADIIYHVLMLDIIKELEKWIHTQEDLVQLRHHLGISMPCIVWADDLAVCWCTKHAADLLPALLRLLPEVQRIFEKRFLKLNFGRGKTAAVVHSEDQVHQI